MQSKTQLAGLLGLAGAALAWTPVLEALRFAPAEGTTVEKTFTNEFDIELDDFSMIVSGQDIGQMLGVPSMQISGGSEMVFEDEYGAVTDGRPKKLTRTFATLGSDTAVSFEMMGESSEEGGEVTSPLEGQTVVFTWDGDAEEYRVEFAEGSAGDDDLLEGLEEDADMRSLLPSGDVEEDQSWSFDPEVLQALLMPGGDLAWESDEMADADMEEFEEMFGQFGERAFDSAEELLDGEGTATFRGTREVDGREVGVIGLEVEVGSSVDFASLIQELIEAAIQEADGEVPDDLDVYVESADVSLDIEAEGELLWDMATNTPFSVRLSGDFSVAVDLVVSGTAEGETQDLELAVEMSGVMSSGMTSSR
jgi:hypothetical protein